MTPSLRTRASCAAALVLVVLEGCSKRTNAPEVSEDPAKLKALIGVPKGVTSVRWLVHGFPSNGRSLPGQGEFPSAMGLAYLETTPAFWTDEGYLLSPGNTVARKFIEERANALFPKALLATGSASGGWLELSCVRLAQDAFGPQERVSEALRCGTGLVVSFKVP